MTGFTYGTSNGATHGTENGGTYGTTVEIGEVDSPGFTYGTVNGAQYGDGGGGTWGVPFRRWVIGMHPLGEIIEETRKWDMLTLVFRADKEMVINRLRPFDSDAGKLEILDRSDGGFLTVDRADGRNTYYLRPPAGRVPPRLAGNYLVDEYSEEVVDQQGQEYRVTLSLAPEEDRDTNSQYAETVDAGEWEFDFETGTVATPRVQANLGGGASSGTQGKRLRLILTDRQVQVLEESASLLNAVRTREVPDGENISEDNSPGDRNTVAVTSPDEEVFASGNYVVQEWQTEMQNDIFHRVTLSLKTSG